MFQCRASRTLSRLALWLGTLAACLYQAVPTAIAQGPVEAVEYQKKAECIGSFTRFVDWPARKFQQPDTPFVIGVFGVDNISAALQEALGEIQIKGRPTLIKHLLNKQELRACHVLFISKSEKDRLGPILGEVRRENVLTVGECDNFLSKGGIINFVTVGGQVHFQISTVAAQREKLVVSSKLLQLAVPPSQAISVLPPNVFKLSEAPP